MGDAPLTERRRMHGVGDDRLLLLPGAGHLLRPPVTPTTVDRNDALVSGGTPHGTARGQRAAWDANLEFLARATRNT
jgi:BAAT / Acyl-CoA thioester hydrolase C terminal